MKTTTSRTVIAAAALLLVAGIAGSALAGHRVLSPAADSLFTPAFWGFGDKKKEEQAAKPKEYAIHDDEAFAKETKPYSLMPMNKAELEYEILIPKDWIQQEAYDTGESGSPIVSMLSLFKSPMIGTFWLEVQTDAKKLDHEISAKHWLKNYILASGYTPDSEVEEQSLKSASAMYIKTGDPGAPSSSEYVTARISGNWVLLATCRAPLPLKEYGKYIQKKACDSFKILYPKTDPIEEQKIFTLVDSIKFNYPSSWSVTATDFRDMNRLAVHLENKGPSVTVEGFIRFIAIRRSRSTDFTSEIVEQRKYFDDVMKLDVIKMISTGKSKVYDRFNFNRYEVYDMAPKKAKTNLQEVHMLALGDKEWYIFGYLFTQKEASNLYNWARNVQTFDEILKSIK